MISSAVPGDHHTTTALSDSRLNEIRSVQPGCWYSGQWMVRHPDGNTGRVEIVHTDSFGDTVIARMPDFLDDMAHFLVDARTAVPELLAEVERLRAQLADYTHPIAHCFSCHHPAPWHIGELGSTERACTQHACGCTNLTREN